MAARRRFSVFVLVAHMVFLSLGNIEGAFEKILPGSLSRASIEDKSTKAVDKAMKNVTLNGEANNSSTIPRATSILPSEVITIEKEKKLENDLEEALENVVASGQTLIVISAAQAENSTRQIFSPLIVIEGPSTSTTSSLIVKSAEAESTTDRTSAIFDQDISPSHSRTRLTPRHYADSEHTDNIEHILAVAEYEPQKLGAREIREEISDDTRRDKTNHQERSTGHRIPEETRYNDSGQRNFPRKLQKGNDYTTKTTSASHSTLASSDLPLMHKERTRSRPQLFDYNYKGSKREASLPPTFREKSSDDPGVERPREPRHSKLSASSTAKIDLSLSHLPNGLERPSEYSIIKDNDVENFTDDLESSIKKYHKSPIEVSHASLPGAKFRMGGQNGVSFDREKMHYPALIAETRKLAQTMDKQVDGYSSTVYNARPSEDQTHRVPNNVQLGFLTRYNLPSLILPRPSRLHAHSLGAATHNRPIVVTKNIKEKDESDYMMKNHGQKVSKSDESTYDYYQDSEEQRLISQTPSTKRPSAVHYFEKKFPTDEAIPTLHDSQGDHKVQTKTSNSYEKPMKSIPTFGPIDETLEDYGITNEPKLMDHSIRSTMKQRQSFATASDPRIGIPTRSIYRPVVYPPEASMNQIKLLNGPIDPYAINHRSPIAFSPSDIYADDKRRKSKPELLSENLGKPEPSLSVANKKTGDGNTADVSYDRYENPRRILAKGKNNDRMHRKANSIQHPPLSENLFGSSSSLSPVPRLTNSQPTSDLTVGISTSNRVAGPFTEITKNRLVGEGKIQSPISSDRPVDRVALFEKKHKHQMTSLIGKSTDDDSNGYGSPVDVHSTPLEGPRSAEYGRRVRPSVEGEYEESSRSRLPVPAYRTKSTKLTIDRSDIGKVGPVGSNEEPAASVHQADVIENTDNHEKEEASSSEYEAPLHENYEVHEESKKDEAKDEESEIGGGEKHVEGHRASGGEKGEKGYKEWHEYDKGKKGHHDSEKHEKEYDESKGGKKKHDDLSGYHEEHHHGEKASKGSEFDEEGAYQKGHSTKGQHVVHKNDEYEKKTEFYDESNEEDDGEKEGEYHYEHEDEEGGHVKIGHHDLGYHVGKYGETGEREKGRHWNENEGHEDKNGRESEHKHEEKYGKKGTHEEGEEWSHQNGKKETR